MACQDSVELVTEYLARALSLPSRAGGDIHPSACKPDRIYLEQIRQTIDPPRRRSYESLEDGSAQKLSQRFRMLTASR